MADKKNPWAAGLNGAAIGAVGGEKRTKKKEEDEKERTPADWEKEFIGQSRERRENGGWASRMNGAAAGVRDMPRTKAEPKTPGTGKEWQERLAGAEPTLPKVDKEEILRRKPAVHHVRGGAVKPQAKPVQPALPRLDVEEAENRVEQRRKLDEYRTNDRTRGMNEMTSNRGRVLKELEDKLAGEQPEGEPAGIDMIRAGKGPIMTPEDATETYRKKQTERVKTAAESRSTAETAAAPALTAEERTALLKKYTDGSESAKRARWDKARRDYADAELKHVEWTQKDSSLRLVEEAYAAKARNETLTPYQEDLIREHEQIAAEMRMTGRALMAQQRREVNAGLSATKKVMDENGDLAINGYPSIQQERADRYKGNITDVEMAADAMIRSGRTGEWAAMWTSSWEKTKADRAALAADIAVLKEMKADPKVIAEAEERLAWLDEDMDALADISVVVNEDFQKYAAADPAVTDLDYRMINFGEIPQVNAMGGDYYQTVTAMRDRVATMTETEKGVYNYIFKTRGRDEAKAYLDRIGERLHYRKAQGDQDRIAKAAKEDPWGMSAMSVLTLPMQMPGYVYTAMSALTGHEANPYDETFSMTRKSGAARSAVRENIKGEAGRWLYDTVMSMADMGAAALYGGNKLTGLMMAIPAGSGTAMDYLERGATTGEAAAASTATAGVEILSEKGFDKAFSAFKKVKGGKYNTFLKKVGRIALAGVQEAGEELPGVVLDEVIDRHLMGQQSGRVQLINKHMAEGKTLNKAIEAADRDFIAGLVSTLTSAFATGGLMEGVGMATGVASARRDARQVMKQHPELDPQKVRAATEMLHGIRPMDENAVMEALATEPVMEAAQEEERKVFAAPVMMNDAPAEVVGLEEAGSEAKVRVRQNGTETVVPMESVTFLNLNQRAAYGYASAYGNEETARQFLAGFEMSDVPLANYAKGFEAAYVAGRHGRYLLGTEQTWAKALPDFARNAATEAGRKMAAGIDAKIDFDPDVAEDLRKKVQVLPALATEDYTGVVLNVRHTERLSDAQAVQIAVLNEVGKKYGTQYIVVDSFQDKAVQNQYLGGEASVDGAKINGMYRAGTNQMVIALDAEEGNLLRVAGHESWHYIKEHSARNGAVQADAMALQEFVLERLKATEGYDLETRIAEKQDQYRQMTGQELDRDAAIEEIVADSLMEVLATEENVRDLMENHPKLGEKIHGFVRRFLGHIRDTLRRIGSRNPEARAMLEQDEKTLQQIAGHFDRVMTSVNAMQQAERMAREAAAMEEFNSEAMAIASGMKDENGNWMFSARSMQEDYDTYKAMLRAAGVHETEISKLYKTIDAVMKVVLKNRSILDHGWNVGRNERSFSPVKDNSDPLYEVSVDFSTLCRKRLLQQAVQERLESQLDAVLTKEQRVAIRNQLVKLQEEGMKIEVACGLCYVEAARLKSPKQIQRFYNDKRAVFVDYFAKKNREYGKQIQATVDRMTREMGYEAGTAKKNMSRADNAKITKAKQQMYTKYTPTAEEEAIIQRAMALPNDTYKTAKGLWGLRNDKENAVIFDAYTSFVRNATKAKGIEDSEAWWAGDSAKISDALIARMNAENGLRSQSWSDFQVIHLLDYMAAIIELSTRKAKMQTYTKVPDFVNLMGDTGAMINLSLIPNDYDGELSFDPKEGMDFDTALKLRDQFPDTVGTICIGISREHIIALLRSADIDYVIPYHSSGLDKKSRRQMGLKEWDDFQRYQTEKQRDYPETDRDSADYHNAPKFSEWFDYKQVAADAKRVGAEKAMRLAADRYIELCHERGLQEKFTEFSEEPNYWKLLIDRKMINHKTGTIIEQKAVQPKFDTKRTLKILGDELKRYKAEHADFDKAVDIITEKWMDGEIEKAAKSKEVIDAVQKYNDTVIINAILDQTAEEKTQGNKFSVAGSEMVNPDIRYSLKDVDSFNSEMEVLLEENNELREVVKMLHTKLNEYSGRAADEKAVRKVANSLRRKYVSTVPLNTLTENLTRAFDAMQTATDARQREAAMQMMSNIALDMVEKSQVADRDAYDNAKELRDRLRKSRIGLTETQWQEAKNLYGSAREFRNAVFGKWGVTAESNRTATTLDMIWPELVQEYPQYFSEDASEGDMVQQVIDMLDATAIKYDNPFGAQIEQVAAGLATEIYEEYLGTEEFAGAQDPALDRLMDRLNDARQTIVKQKRRLKKARREVEEQKQKRADQALRRKQHEDYAKVKNQIIREKSGLLKKLEMPKQGEFVPQAMRNAVLDLLKAVDFEGKLTGGTNKPLSADMLTRAKNAYEGMVKPGADGEASQLASYFNEELLGDFDLLINEADGRRASELSMKQLEALRNVVCGYAAAVRNADRMFMQARKESLQETGDRLLGEMYQRKEHKVQGRVAEPLSKAVNQGLLKPVTVFHMFRGTVMEDVWKALRKSEWTHIRHVQEAGEFLEEMLDKYGMHESIRREGTRKKRENAKELALESGKKVKLTDQELMTLYAASKREEKTGTNHLTGDGFTLANAPKNSSMEPYKLTHNDLQLIANTLTKEQKEYADRMVDYLSSTCADWGNQVTLELYGVEKFTEEYYIPFSVDRNYVAVDPAQQQDNRLKVGSFTKAVKQHAKNALEIKPFTEIWCQHVEKMSDYNAFVLPIEDMTRLMNYRAKSGNVKAQMNIAYGKQTTDYIMSFLKRLNGNARSEMGEGLLRSMIGKAKGAAVTANLSVAIQQMGSASRAMAMIDPAYFFKGSYKALLHARRENGRNKNGSTKYARSFNASWEELQKYAGIAVEKSWGYFDTNMSRGLYQRAQNTLMSRLNDLGGSMAEMGDRMTWARIWEAVKLEQHDLYPEELIDSDGFLEKCAERFTEIIDGTQVVDSIFQRAEFATEKGLMSQQMSFMSEPLTVYNMMYRAAWDIKNAQGKQARSKAWKNFGRTTAAITMASAMTAALKSVVSALRDRDNEEKDEEGNIVRVRNWGDKYVDAIGPAFLENMLGIGTIFTNIAQDAMSAFGGGNDLSVQWLNNMTGGVKQLIGIMDGSKAPTLENWEKVMYKTLQGISGLTGLGFANLWRDVKSIGATVYEIVEADSLAGAAWDVTKPFEVRLAAAEKNYVYKKQPGDGRKENSGIYYDLMLAAYMEGGVESEKFRMAADAAIGTGATWESLAKTFKTKARTADQRIHDAAMALMDGDMETYARLTTELHDAGFGMRAICSMVMSEIDKTKPKDEAVPGSGEAVIYELGREDVSEDPVVELAEEAMKAAGTPEELKASIDRMRDAGTSEKTLRTKVTSLYKKDYQQAVWKGDKKAADHAAAMMKGAGVEITDEDLEKWSVGSDARSAMYDHIKAGSAKDAIEIRGAMYNGVGQKETNEYIRKWAQSYVKDHPEEEGGIRGTLLKMGYSKATLDGWFGK